MQYGITRLGPPPDEVDDVTRDDVGLIELQEVPAVLDERDLASVGQHPLDPRRVILRAAIVGAVRYSVGNRGADSQCLWSSAYWAGGRLPRIVAR